MKLTPGEPKSKWVKYTVILFKLNEEEKKKKTEIDHVQADHQFNRWCRDNGP